MNIMTAIKTDIISPKRHEFYAASHGYDTHEIDALRSENESLKRFNNELYHLWLNEFANNASTMQEWAENGENRDKLYNLLIASSELIHPQQETQVDIAEIQESPVEIAETEVSICKKRSRAISFFKELLFYLILATIVFGAFLFSGDPAGPPLDIAGFSVMTVLTRSMQSELPQHSLIVTRKVDPQSLQVGDDITFLIPNNSTVTHRIIEIFEDYQNSGIRGFQTQGVENINPDTEVVLAHNIVGRVIFHNLTLGRGVNLIRDNVFIVGIGLFLLALVYVLTKLLRMTFSKKKDALPNGTQDLPPKNPHTVRGAAETPGHVPTPAEHQDCTISGAKMTDPNDPGIEKP